MPVTLPAESEQLFLINAAPRPTSKVQKIEWKASSASAHQNSVLMIFKLATEPFAIRLTMVGHAHLQNR
jgi:hypothetical protein